MKVDGYDYEAFCAAVAELHGAACWVRATLAAREVPLPPGLLDCAGQLDGHHLLPKRVLKRERGSGGVRLAATTRALYTGTPSREVEYEAVTIGALLNDGRDGVPACRRHHDLVERALVRIRRAELPRQVEEFAAEIGLGWYLEREFGPCPAS